MCSAPFPRQTFFDDFSDFENGRFLEILSGGAIFDKLRSCSSNEGGHFGFFKFAISIFTLPQKSPRQVGVGVENSNFFAHSEAIFKKFEQESKFATN